MYRQKPLYGKRKTSEKSDQAYFQLLNLSYKDLLIKYLNTGSCPHIQGTSTYSIKDNKSINRERGNDTWVVEKDTTLKAVYVTY